MSHQLNHLQLQGYRYKTTSQKQKQIRKYGHIINILINILCDTIRNKLCPWSLSRTFSPRISSWTEDLNYSMINHEIIHLWIDAGILHAILQRWWWWCYYCSYVVIDIVCLRGCALLIFSYTLHDAATAIDRSRLGLLLTFEYLRHHASVCCAYLIPRVNSRYLVFAPMANS